MKNPNQTEFLGFELAFSLPDWFPPQAQNYRTVHRDYTTTWGNHAWDELNDLPSVHETAIQQICGNWVTFKFENTPVRLAPTKAVRCQRLINAILKKWAKPVNGHEYLVQKADDGGYEVYDLTENRIVWNDRSYERCQNWIDQPVSDVGEEE